MNTAPTNIIQFESFNGFAVGVRPADTYIDATALCRANRKKFNDYARLGNTQEFLEELSGSIGIPVGSMGIPIDHVSRSVGIPQRSAGIPANPSVTPIDRDGMGLIFHIMTGPNEFRGTYVHPRVAIHLAQWASPKCAVWVTDLVYRYLTGETISAKADQAKATKDPQSLFWSNVERLTGLGATPTSAVYAATKLLEGHAPRKRDGIHPEGAPKAVKPKQDHEEEFRKVFHDDQPIRWGPLMARIEDTLGVSHITAQRRILRWTHLGYMKKSHQGYQKTA